MKKLLLTSLLTFASLYAVSDDTELYLSDSITTAAPKKKVLLIFDNSGSMGKTHTVKEAYKPGTTYGPVKGLTSFSDKFIYFTKGGVDNTSLPVPDSPSEARRFLDSINNCATARHLLATQGFYTGKIREYSQKGNTGTWVEIPDNNGANVEIVDCQDDVNLIPETFSPKIDSTKNLGIDPKTGSVFASPKHDGYPVNGPSDKKDPTYFGSIADSKVSVDWSGAMVTLYTDNYLRYYHNDDGDVGDVIETRMETAKRSIVSVINGTPNVEFGLEVFNYNDGDASKNKNGGRIAFAIKEMNAANKSTLIDIINNDIGADNWTPLCESLYEASRYFAGDKVEYGNDDTKASPKMDSAAVTSSNYNTPFSGCSDLAHVILITDGEPTYDQAANEKIKALTSLEQKLESGEPVFDADGDPVMEKHTFKGTKYDDSFLPALAEWMFTRDINPSIEGIQRASTTTIGFSSGADDAKDLLTETAKLGGGSFYTAKSGLELTSVLLEDLRKLPITNETLTSASVAANNFDRTQTLNSVYYAMFTPQSSPRWQGNLKKYKVTGKKATQYGKNGAAAINESTGHFSKGVQSFWSSGVDGNKVAEGGVAEMLANMKTARNLYSDTGASSALEKLDYTSFKSFYGGADKAATELGIAETELEGYFNWAKGIDVDDEDNDKSTTDMRKDTFADPLHSKPVVVNYGGADKDNPDIRIVIGTNAGVLHMFKDNDKANTVEESWAFMPNEFFDLIQPLRDNASGGSKLYGIDGKITAFLDDKGGDGTIGGSDRAWLFFGLRRGGTTYYAIDVSDKTTPELMWKIDSSTAGFEELGQSWSQPKIMYTKLNSSGDTARPTLVFGGGYDTNKDVTTPGTADSAGRAIYMVDAETGDLVWSLAPSGGKTTYLGTDSIPASIGFLDSNSDGLADRLYAGDTGGNVWRIDMPSDKVADVSVFKLAELGGTTNDTDRRFFSEPSIVRTFISETIETTKKDGSKQIERQELPYDAILIGSGDRTNPLGTDTDDALFMIKDEHIQTHTFTDSSDPAIPDTILFDDLYNYTNDPFGGFTPPLSTTEQATLDALALKVSEKSGWYIDLTQDGEKSSSAALAINGVAYFTSFTPPDLSGLGADVCVVPSGSGWLYAVDLAFGTKVYDWEKESEKNRSDRIAYISEQFLGSPTLIVTDDGDDATDDDAIGNIIVGRKIIPVGFQLQTMRTYMYITEDQ